MRRNGAVILRSYSMYWPFQTFGFVAGVLLLLGLGLGGRFAYFYVTRWPQESGHTESLLVAVGAIVLAFLVGLVALLGDLIAANRRLNEQMLVHLRQLETAVTVLTDGPRIPGLERTTAAPWSTAITPPVVAVPPGDLA